MALESITRTFLKGQTTLRRAVTISYNSNSHKYKLVFREGNKQIESGIGKTLREAEGQVFFKLL